MEANSSRRVIALLTDFGTADHYVAAMKGVVLGIVPDASLIDISHETGPQDIVSAGFLLWACYRDMPRDTVFLCVVDPGVGSGRRRIILRTDRYQFVAPDNGLLSFVAERENGEFFEIRKDANLGREISGTFDGRDIFGPVAARLALGVGAEELGDPIADPELPDTGLNDPEDGRPKPGRILYIDVFGNLVTNLWPADLPAGAALRIRGTTVDETRSYFSEGAVGGLFKMVGSTGLIEISSNRSSAAEAIGARAGDDIEICFPNVGLGQ